MRSCIPFPKFISHSHSCLCGSLFSLVQVVVKKALWSSQNNHEAWGSLPVLPVHHLGTSHFLRTSRVERECSLGGGLAPLPHLRPLGFNLLAQPALPLTLFAMFLCLTPGSTEQLEGGRPGIAPFIFSLLSILGTKRGFLRRGAVSSYSDNPQISRNRQMEAGGTTDFPSL